MNDLTTLPEADELERLMLPMEQVEVPTVHHFGPGVYIREITIPPGTLLIGHAHKEPHLCVLQKGTLRVIDGEGEAHEMTSPAIFTAGAGRKVGLVAGDEPVVFWNVFPNPDDERDIETLEDRLVVKSEAWREHQKCLS